MADAVTWREIRRERVIYEDDDVLAIDKPVGLSVMGERHGTDLVRLAADAGEELHPAHRIDKVTSGVCLLARSLTVHGDLTRQFNKREVAKRYLAVVLGRDIPPAATVELPLLTASSGRVRIAAPRDAIRFDAESATYAVAPAAVSAQRHYPSTTRFEVEVAGEDAALLSVEPVTGRRHQIRVHLAWIGFPIAGDPLFASTSRARELARTHLHAHRLTIRIPASEEPRAFEAEPELGFSRLVAG